MSFILITEFVGDPLKLCVQGTSPVSPEAQHYWPCLFLIIKSINSSCLTSPSVEWNNNHTTTQSCAELETCDYVCLIFIPSSTWYLVSPQGVVAISLGVAVAAVQIIHYCVSLKREAVPDS